VKYRKIGANTPFKVIQGKKNFHFVTIYAFTDGQADGETFSRGKYRAA